MTILTSLVRAYDRLAVAGEVPVFGYSLEKIGFMISLNADGMLAGTPIDLRDGEGRKKRPRLIAVPQPAKRTSGIVPNFLWDKTSYALGVTAGEGKRLAEEHAAFVAHHERWLADTRDEGLRALLLFLRAWTPGDFARLGWPEDLKDQNVVFALESERRTDTCIHDRSAAKDLWARMASEGGKKEAICLLSGRREPISRLHPAIKGVRGAQSSGASLVSFNLDSFTSYGHEQGENAPLSERATFAYTTVLNKFLSGKSNRIQVGDTSTVFWADGSGAEEAETIFAAMFGDEGAADAQQVNEAAQASRVRGILEGIRQGQPLEALDPALAKGVRFSVLGLAPNASRLSVRFWFDDDFGTLARNYQKFVSEMMIEPPARIEKPKLWHYLREIAVLGKTDNIPPNLAGEWFRSILSGSHYPMTLLSTTLMRIRTDKNVNALRASILKALLMRNFKKEVPVALDANNQNKGYLLGRLFAVYEQIQTAALGQNVNATVKDKYYAAASAQPRKVFPRLESGAANHLSKIRKAMPGYRHSLERQIAEIMGLMSPADDPFPSFLSNQEQALFSLGYYHQRFSKPANSVSKRDEPSLEEEIA